MKTIKILVLIIYSQLTFAQTFQWEGSIGGSGGLNYPNSIWVGNDGSTYIIGNYDSHQLKYGNQILSSNLQGSPMNFFLLKINSSGTPVFVRDAQYTSSAIGLEVCTDSNQNIYNLIINNSNAFWLTIDNDTIWTEYGGAGAIIVKYDSSGNYIWGKPFSNGDSYSINARMDIVDDNNIICSSSNKKYILDSLGNCIKIDRSLIICDFDSSGNIKWSRSIRNKPNLYKIEIDKKENINILCQKNIDSVYIDNQLIASDTFQFFILRLNKEGDFLEYIPFQSNDVYNYLTFTIDKNFNIYFSGDYIKQSFTVVNLQSQNKLTANSRDVFVVKTDYHGVGKWINSIQSYSVKEIRDLNTDDFGGLYLIGQQSMDSGIYYNNSFYPASPGYLNYLIKMDSLGNMLDYIPSNNSSDWFYSFEIVSPNEIYITSQGSHGSPIFSNTFGPTYGFTDICFGKFSFNTSIENKVIDNKLIIYPNPTNDFVNFNFIEDLKLQHIEIIDVTGKKVKGFYKIDNKTNKITISDLTRGVYFIEFYTNKGNLTRRIIKK